MAYGLEALTIRFRPQLEQNDDRMSEVNAEALAEPRLVAETGLAGFEVLGWFALLAPAKTPPEVVRRLNSDVNAAIARPAIVARFAELGAEPLGGSPDQAAAFIKGEQDKWGKIIRDAGIKQQ